MLDEHLGYVADAVRLERYRSAIARSIVPGSTVADLGCGTGILGLLCLQAGAGHVYAIDDSAMLDIARDSLTRAGYGERVTFVHGKSGQVELPTRVDVVICDHVGYFGFDYGVVGLLDDARRRFLKPGGRLIPSTIRLGIAAAGSQRCSELAHGWQAGNIPPEFHWLHRYSVNTKHSVLLERDDLLSAPATLGEINLAGDNPAFFSWSAELRIKRDAIMHGVAGWFDCQLADEVWMTNSPLADNSIRRAQAFLPIGEAIPVKAGESVKVTIMARPVEQLIAWTVEFPASGRRFSHSTWQGMMLSPENLVRARPGHVPTLSRPGQARLTVLGYCDGTRTMQEIEAAVLRDHPDLFPSREEICSFVAQVLGRDTD